MLRDTYLNTSLTSHQSEIISHHRRKSPFSSNKISIYDTRWTLASIWYLQIRIQDDIILGRIRSQSSIPVRISYRRFPNWFLSGFVNMWRNRPILIRIGDRPNIGVQSSACDRYCLHGLETTWNRKARQKRTISRIGSLNEAQPSWRCSSRP